MWRSYIALLVMNVAVVSLCGMWIMYFPLYANEYLGLSPQLIGLIFTVSSIGSIVSTVAGGIVAEVLGKRATVAIGILVAMLSVTTMLLNNVYLACLGFTTYFIGLALSSPALHALILDSAPQRAQGTLYMVASRVVPSIPPLVTLPLAGYLYEKGMYRTNLLLGLVGLAIAASMLLLVEEKSSRVRQRLSEALYWLRALISKDRTFLTLVLVFGIDTMLLSGLEWYTPIYLKGIGYSALAYGMTMGLASIAIAVGSLASGGMVDKLGPRKTCIASFLLSSLITVLFIAVPSFSLAMLLLWKIAGSLPRAVPPTVIARQYPRNKALALSAYSVAIRIADIPGPLIIGVLASYSAEAPFALRALLLLLLAVAICIGLQHTHSYRD